MGLQLPALLAVSARTRSTPSWFGVLTSAAPWLLSLSRMIIRATYVKPLGSFWKNFFAVFLSRRRCTGIFNTWPC